MRMKEKEYRLKELFGLIAIITIFLLLTSTSIGSAKTYPAKPEYNDYGTSAVYSVQLSPKYYYMWFMESTGSYADIIGRHTIAVKQLKPEEMMIFAGKYGKKYYFNLMFEDITEGVYYWKPGETSFRREAKGIAFDQFKNYHKIPWSGAKIGRYVTAARGWPMEPCPRPKVYIYNLKTGHKRFLDKNVFGAKRVGKKIYYVKGIWDKAGFKRLEVKRCNANGKGKKYIRTIYLKRNSYVKYANPTKHYIKARINGKLKKYKYR